MLLRRTRGFTLVELMVVTVIIGLIASIGIPRFQEQLLISRLKEAEPYLQAIAAKQRINFVQTGQYVMSNNEQDIEDQLGVDLSATGSFCFMTHCTGATCNAIAAVNGPVEALAETGQAGDVYFEVYAVIRASDNFDATARSGAATTACTAVADKVDPADWTGVDADAGSPQGEVVVLRYPAPTNTLTDSTNAFVWTEGITISGVLYDQ